MYRSIFTLAVCGPLALAACSAHSTTSTGPLPTCSGAAATLALSPNADTSLDLSADSGCITFAADSTADSAEYLVVAQSAGGIPGDTAAFQLRSAQLSALLAARQPGALTGIRPAWKNPRGPAAVAFGRFLHRLERTHSVPGRLGAATPGVQSIHPGLLQVVRPTVGSLRSFSVCADLNCTTFRTVTAQARSVGTHVAIYVDTLAPANGLDSAQIDTLQQVFDEHVYAVDTAAFGGVSDVDSNGVVIALMTPVVNSLVTATQCNTGGYVGGFFFPPDLDPATATQFNDGEIFYTIVADPNGVLSCPHTTADLEGVLPETFLHELQHLISFNQHVLIRGGAPEELWLDEALSCFAEELGGRSFLPDSATFGQYVSEDLYDAYSYLADPGDSFLLQTGDTTLADFGAGWLYMRYLVDQYGSALTQKLEQTPLTGTDNVATQTGLPFSTTVARWALANWTSDLPGFSPPAGLFYRSWSFRQVFAMLNAQDPVDFPQPFPLVPVRAADTQVNLSGTLHAGSGFYADILQPPGASSFTLEFTGPGAPLPSGLVPRLAIVRLR